MSEPLGLALTVVFIAGAVVGWAANSVTLPVETRALFDRGETE